MALQLLTGEFAALPGDKTYRFVAPQGWNVAFVTFSVVTEGAIADIQTYAPVLDTDNWTNLSVCKVEINNSGAGNVNIAASLLVSDELVGQITVPGDLAIGSGWGLVGDSE